MTKRGRFHFRLTIGQRHEEWWGNDVSEAITRAEIRVGPQRTPFAVSEGARALGVVAEWDLHNGVHAMLESSEAQAA